MEPIDRICPFLALAADHRTVVDGYDPDHRCHALAEPDPLDHPRQAQLCLTEGHRECERFVAAIAARRADWQHVPMPAVDARIARTRLVLSPEATGRSLASGRPVLGDRARRVAVAATVATLGVVLLASGAADGLVGLFGALPPSPTSHAVVTSEGAPSPAADGEPSAEESASPTAEATPASTPTSAGTPVPAASPRSYVVEEGDTLSAIAARFGTTVAAIQAANGLGQRDVINIGQVLVIP